MEKQAQVTLRMNPELKKMATDFFDACGISFNQGAILLIKQAMAKGSITLRPAYNKETMAAFKEADDILEHPEKYKSYNSAREMMDDILEDDNV